MIEEMMKNGKIERPYMGIGLADLEQVPRMYVKDFPEDIKGGVMVTAVDPESAAGKAGLEVEDIIVAINGTEMKNSNDLRKVLYTDLKVGDKATFKVYRGGELKTIEITLTSVCALQIINILCKHLLFIGRRGVCSCLFSVFVLSYKK